jgi:L-threonate 2-dehydrogenase
LSSSLKKTKSVAKKSNTNNSTHVGIIGLGIMGSAIASNLVKAGFTVEGYDPSAEQQKLLAKAGVKISKTVEELASHNSIILMSIPSVPVLESSVQAIAKNSIKGTIVAELSTLPNTAKLAAKEILAKKGIALLDCPLSGTGAQAKTRDLAIYASGDAKLIKKMEHVFAGFARVNYNVGEFGCGMQMKLIANLLVAIHNVSTAEAILLGAQMGLDPQKVVDVISDGAGSSRMFQVRGPAMANRSWDDATMKIEVWAKDMHLIGEAIKEYSVPTPLFNACAPVYHAAKALGHAKRDTAVVYEVLERWSKPLKPKTAAKSSKK